MKTYLDKIFNSVVSGNREVVVGEVQMALDAKLSPESILNQGLILAMAEVGDRFERNEFYVPEMLIAARAMQSGLAILKPLLVEAGIQPSGKVVIGTVKGDLHDIGKNLVAMMLEGAGYEIIDLGTDVSPGKFAEAVREHAPDIVALSALLTTTMPEMENTIEALDDIGLREQLKVIIGGAPVTREYALKIGADGYAADASRTVSIVDQIQ